eukprot:6370899-Amphidinium_carterae.2
MAGLTTAQIGMPDALSLLMIGLQVGAPLQLSARLGSAAHPKGPECAVPRSRRRRFPQMANRSLMKSTKGSCKIRHAKRLRTRTGQDVVPS